MITIVILVVVIVMGYFLHDRLSDYMLPFVLGGLMSIGGGILMVLHLFLWSITSYEYGKFVSKRDSLQQSLDWSRANSSELERAAILQDISEFNKDLAEHKYNNKTLLLTYYIDDRIEDVEPIK